MPRNNPFGYGNTDADLSSTDVLSRILKLNMGLDKLGNAGMNPKQVAQNKPRIQNPDGSVSTERTISIGVNGEEVLIPTIVNGEQLTNEQAIKAFKDGSISPIKVFSSKEEANRYAQERSNRIGQEIKNRDFFTLRSPQDQAIDKILEQSKTVDKEQVEPKRGSQEKTNKQQTSGIQNIQNKKKETTQGQGLSFVDPGVNEADVELSPEVRSLIDRVDAMLGKKSEETRKPDLSEKVDNLVDRRRSQRAKDEVFTKMAEEGQQTQETKSINDTVTQDEQTTKIVNKISDFDSMFNVAGDQFGLDPNFLAAVSKQESAFDPKAESPVGAKGLMQLMPIGEREAARLGVPVEDVWDPMNNIRAGAATLRNLIDRFDDVKLALAAYNWGQGRVASLLRDLGASTFEEIKDKLPDETRNYVPKIIANYRQFRKKQQEAAGE